ncbi:hypothetical protein J2Y69_002749 [Microbacterium resistens]|uniref:Uncharacterized protein n=1 Tax=Microbacterium resistens TaxID=156977 RepID=A0ABU1SEV4_9MICO|nr:hypothetical protein [Microbacterium resistens]MDR6868138.1 hypothetical protein [Microbacterium resistens]
MLQLLALNDGIRAQRALLPDEVDYADTLEAATHGSPGAKHRDRGDGA